MITLKQAQGMVNNELCKLNIGSTPKELYDPIDYVINLGGKRIRPALAILSCNLFSDNVNSSLGPAVALEVFHNFTLVHDDIMDNANLRRGKETVHIRWNNNVAILSGDAMCIKAYEKLSECDERYLKKVLLVFNETALKVCEGQQYDMNFENRQSVTEVEYLKMIELKTSVLLAGSLKIGAIIGGASDDEAELLYNFGLNLGMAFQLQDDLLDVFGDESILGKEIGKDIISNKKTYLLIKALEIATGSQLNTLKNWLLSKNFNNDDKIKGVQTIYLGLGIKELTLKAIEKRIVESLCDLKKVSVLDERKVELTNFIYSMRNRKY